ncbi:jg19507, partial [Pararge aegeria aegeria]
MAPHMMALAVCRLQRRAVPPLPSPHNASEPTESPDDLPLPPPEVSLYSDQQVILDESGPLLEWVQKTIQLFGYELNTSYPLPKF